MRVLLISTYDSGHQPFGLASPAASLRRAGVEVRCADIAKEQLPEQAVRDADLIAFFLPMHTATRLAVPVVDRVRMLNARARLAAYGLYAPLNADLLREHGIGDILAGEFEDDLVRIAKGRRPHDRPVDSGHDAVLGPPAAGDVARVTFETPDRSGLPPLTRYASLIANGERRTSGYTEASRGCKHLCRHCPIVPVYEGRFRIVPIDVVLADVRAQVEAGARHITFGDPDFFNGIRHAAALIDRFGREFPAITYDVTIKVEHLLRHADLLPILRDTGCAFVTSAVESLDDRVLEQLAKGHTRADFERVVALCRRTGLVLSPTFVAFTPWTTIESYCDLLHTIDRLHLVDHVAPIQLAIRLLVPHRSRLLELADIQSVVNGFHPQSLVHTWRHPDPRVDDLQSAVECTVGVRIAADRRETFARIWRIAHDHARVPPPSRRDDGLLPRAAIPYMNEPWYC